MVYKGIKYGKLRLTIPHYEKGRYAKLDEALCSAYTRRHNDEWIIDHRPSSSPSPLQIILRELDAFDTNGIEYTLKRNGRVERSNRNSSSLKLTS